MEIEEERKTITFFDGCQSKIETYYLNIWKQKHMGIFVKQAVTGKTQD